MNGMRIHNREERLAARRLGERRASVSLVQLLCAVSILRTGLTQVLPLAGGAMWWTLLLCLLPGAALFLLTGAALRLTGTQTLPDLARKTLGRSGAWALTGVMTALLLADATATLTALITLFTEGIGTRGTQLTLALLTGGALALCLHREGLARGTYLLRWGLLAGALIVAAGHMRHVRADNLFPLQGDGLADTAAALLTGASLAWPLLLLLFLPGEGGAQGLRDAIPAVMGPVAVLLCIGLIVPHERLAVQGSLADALLLAGRYASPAVRLVLRCTVLLAFFLAIGGALQWGAALLCGPMRQAPRWLPWLLLAALTASQALDTPSLWRILMRWEPWLLLPLAAIIVPCAVVAIFRRDRM